MWNSEFFVSCVCEKTEHAESIGRGSLFRPRDSLRMASSPARSPQAKGPPTSIGSHVSPTGEEITLWTFAQLEQVPRRSLQARALDLKKILQPLSGIPAGFCNECRTNMPEQTMLWILQGQCHLLATFGKGATPEDFGYPAPDETASSPKQIFNGELPSIKKTKESILASGILKAGPNMHDP